MLLRFVLNTTYLKIHLKDFFKQDNVLLKELEVHNFKT